MDPEPKQPPAGKPTRPAPRPNSSSLRDSVTGLARQESDAEITHSKYSVPPVGCDVGHYQNNVKNVVKIQSAIRRVMLCGHYKLLVKLHRKRTCVAREIWHSETKYLEGLMTMLQIFKRPLQLKATTPDAILQSDQIEILFSNLDQLIETSKKLLRELQEMALKWTPRTRVGNLITRNSEMLKHAFTPYVDNYDIASGLFVKLKQENKKFQDFLIGLEFKVCDLGLESYLIMPIQRVARYGLLLRELIKQTWQDHDDYQDLLSALKTIDLVTAYVNEHKAKAVNFEKVKMIQSMLVNCEEDLAGKPERQYILEGAFTEINKLPITHYLFLFNDVLIWTQQVNKKKYMFKRLNYLSRSTAEAGELNSVKIITDGWETKIFTKSKEEQNQLVAYIENESFSPVNEPPKPVRPDIVFRSFNRIYCRRQFTESVFLLLSRKRMIASRLHLNSSGSLGGTRRTSVKVREMSRGRRDSSGSDPSKGEGKSSPKVKDKKNYARKAATIDAQTFAAAKEKHEKSKDKESSKKKERSPSDKSPFGSGRGSLTPDILTELKKKRAEAAAKASGAEDRRQTVQFGSESPKSSPTSSPRSPSSSPRNKDQRMSEQLPVHKISDTDMSGDVPPHSGSLDLLHEPRRRPSHPAPRPPSLPVDVPLGSPTGRSKKQFKATTIASTSAAEHILKTGEAPTTNDTAS